MLQYGIGRHETKKWKANKNDSLKIYY